MDTRAVHLWPAHNAVADRGHKRDHALLHSDLDTVDDRLLESRGSPSARRRRDFALTPPVR
ncbi:hypothetical protein ACFYR1_53060 [Streptomyces canus]|uniref:hypothetical protein n=1 Tax=Streptomyces canus TaxID=58343 RepID=UPI0036BFFE36